MLCIFCMFIVNFQEHGMSSNIEYKTSAIEQFYKNNRIAWKDFYESERHIFDLILKHKGKFGRVLDIGCATGGLGMALSEKGEIDHYVGVEINAQSVQTAKLKPSEVFPARFICADILSCSELSGEKFSTVFSLGVADWNVETTAIIDRAWDHVGESGFLVVSLRLSLEEGINNFKKSYQDIVFSSNQNNEPRERAPYVVFNAGDAIQTLEALTPMPTTIFCYGYWGKPSKTASTPYENLIFSVFAIQKGDAKSAQKKVQLELNLPSDALEQILDVCKNS